jgi:lysophospholipase L1-like esterase
MSTPLLSKSRHLVSLGSSFAAGPGLPPLSLKTALRSSLNYASLLSTHFSYHHTDLTVSGATLSNITTTPQTIFWTTFPPQLASVPEDAHIITLTAGGNDLRYISGLMKDEFLSSRLGAYFGFLMPVKVEEVKTSIEELAERFVEVVDAIHTKAPKAKIYLVEYLTLLSPSTQSGIHVCLPDEGIKKYQQVGRDLQRAYELASQKMSEWCTLVNVTEMSRDHGIGKEEPWVEGLSAESLWRGNAMHPKQRGMRAVADMLVKRLEKDGFVRAL